MCSSCGLASGVRFRRGPESTAASRLSPDGKKLALTLGGSGGNPDIYVLELQTQNLTRITGRPGDRHGSGLGSGWQVHLLHVGSRGRPADLQDRA